MTEKVARYIPAFSYHWLTPVYDPVLKWGMREEIFKRRLISQANIRAGERVLDLGCGTGTLAILLKETIPGADVTGLDGDPAVLKLAGEKADRAGVRITWDRGMAFALPYPDRSFEKVISSLVIHHLTAENKFRAFQEIHRVLKPFGECHVLDFGRPHGPLGWLISQGTRHLEEVKENFDGKLPGLLVEAGFKEVTETASMTCVFGPISLLRAVKY